MALNSADQKFPQSQLLVGSEHIQTPDLIYKLSAQILCESPVKSCGTCRSCLLIKQQNHPDVLLIKPEKPGSAIKIDQIRTLQQTAYQTPQYATHRIIFICPANELNRAASNALLKILEEPPKHLYFILIATHIDTLPSTIMSRCQLTYLKEPKPILNDTTIPGYLALGLHYDEATPRGILFKNQAAIIHKICDVSENKISVCKLASEYSNHALSDWLWFFQLFVSTLIQHQLIPENPLFSEPRIQQLASKHSPVHYFKQLDMILGFIKQINRDIPLNATLTLETVLMGYV